MTHIVDLAFVCDSTNWRYGVADKASIRYPSGGNGIEYCGGGVEQIKVSMTKAFFLLATVVFSTSTGLCIWILVAGVFASAVNYFTYGVIGGCVFAWLCVQSSRKAKALTSTKTTPTSSKDVPPSPKTELSFQKAA
jgi:hypothetical protein